MNRWALVVAGIAVMLGIGAMWILSPVPANKVAVEEEAPTDPVFIRPPPTPRPTRPAPVPYAIGPDGAAGPVVRTPAQTLAMDQVRNQVLPADAKGVTTAALARRTDIVACVQRYWESAGQRGYEGRFTLEITVEGPAGASNVDTQVLNGPPDPTVEDCVAGVMADARFEKTDHPVRVRWPVPMTEPF